MDQSLAKYREALLGVNNIGTPAATVNSAPNVAPQIQNAQNMFQGTFQAGAAKKAITAIGGGAGALANEQDAAAKLKLQEEQDKADAAAKLKEDMLDPNKYRQEIAQDGGYDFYDPMGNKIDIKQYSGVTGKHITELLKKSQNPADQEFVKDYANVEKVGNVLLNGSKKDRDKLFKDQPDIKEDYELLKKHLGRPPTFNDITASFRSGYGKFFNTKQPVAPAKTTYGDKSLDSLGGGNSLLDRIKGIF